MPSELSQRLRAARNYADLRQQDIADACALAGFKVSRSAVAQWEYDDERKTTPSIEQVKVVAKRTGVPLDWLLNDNADVSDVWRAASLGAPMPLAAPPKAPGADRMADAAAKAIEFAALQRRPDLADGFGRVLGHGPLALQPDFLWRNVLVEICTTPPAADTIGAMLMAEQATARKLSKTVILLGGPGAVPHELFGIQVLPASSPDDAAQKLIALCD